MFEREATKVRLELPANLVMLRPLDTFIRDLLASIHPDLDPRSVNDIALVTHEAFTNICVHAYASREGGPAAVEILLKEHQVELSFEDEGNTFDESSWKEPDLDQPRESGLGIWLMKQRMTEFMYSSGADGKNVLRLVKNFRDDSIAED